jgi:tyrosyl-tRNA synthetase
MLDLLAVETFVFESKGEAIKMIMQGAVAINKNKISDLAMLADTSMLIAGKYLLIQKGKKNYYLLTAV